MGITPVHTGFWASTAANAVLKSATTPAATGATIGPVIVHPVFVIPPGKVVPTCPKMPMPGPVSVQVTVPLVGIAFVPRTAKGAVVPRLGATCARAQAGTSKQAAKAVRIFIRASRWDSPFMSGFTLFLSLCATVQNCKAFLLGDRQAAGGQALGRMVGKMKTVGGIVQGAHRHDRRLRGHRAEQRGERHIGRVAARADAYQAHGRRDPGGVERVPAIAEEHLDVRVEVRKP